MTILSDKSIAALVKNQNMIEPFVEQQVKFDEKGEKNNFLRKFFLWL